MEEFPEQLVFFSKYYFWQISFIYSSKGARIMETSINGPSYNDNDKHNFVMDRKCDNAASFETCEELIRYIDSYLKDIDFPVSLYVNLRTKNEKEEYLLMKKEVDLKYWKQHAINLFNCVHSNKWGYGPHRI